MSVIFEPKIRNTKCKHVWIVQNNSFRISFGSFGGLLGNTEFKADYQYMLCPKCNSTAGDKILGPDLL